jgi:hypothetical protein
MTSRKGNAEQRPEFGSSSTQRENKNWIPAFAGMTSRKGNAEQRPEFGSSST